MEFYINNNLIKSEINLSDSIEIQSYNKKYNVIYSNNDLKNIIKNIYNKGDFIVIDRNVYNLDISTFENIPNIYQLDAFEKYKTIETVLLIIDILNISKFTKLNKLISIGGGITQDITGFVSGIYKRGINWVFIPTTLLAMTDSCIGGKVALNRISKNMLGMFVSPNEIYISDYFLNSLDNDNIISGLGESLKLSLIGGKNIYDLFIYNYESKNYINIIKLSSLVKKSIIEIDEFDNNERKILNYGHTFGHAIESTTNYFIPHGIAVLLGMYIINKLFYDDKFHVIDNLILNMLNPKFLKINFDYNTFINHVSNDKKNKGNEICFILVEDLGNSKIVYYKKNLFEKKLKNIIKNIFII